MIGNTQGYLARLKIDFLRCVSWSGLSVVRTFHQGIGVAVLGLLPIAVLLGPRIQVAGISHGDFRVTDLVLVVGTILVVYWEIRVIRFATFTFLLMSSLVATPLFLGILTGPNPGVEFFYSLRLLEPFVLGAVLYQLLMRLGSAGIKTVLASLAGGVFANITWILFQVFSGDKRAFWDFTDRDIHTYGLALVGDAGPFPTGQTLQIMFLGVLALLRFANSNWVQKSIGVLVGSILLGGIALSGSRISVFASIVLLLITLASWAVGKISPRLLATGLVLLLGTGLSFFMTLPRFTPKTIFLDLWIRTTKFYGPATAEMQNSFFFGLGPGHARAKLGAEVHNLYVSLFADFGLVGMIFLAMTVIFFVSATTSDYMSKGSKTLGFFAGWAQLSVAGLAISGLVQDSHVSTTPIHFVAIVIAIYWHFRASGGKGDPPAQRLMSGAAVGNQSRVLL